jgi:2-polyprenyl-3-methyl-5-hydroxy-6-metoxy-1,4-benzoquinol methylase
MNAEIPWQLRQFEKTLKKKIKLDLLRRHLGELDGESCFMVTCGDNNGAMNYHLRECGGQWGWGDFEEDAIPVIEGLLHEPVMKLEMKEASISLPDGIFDRVVVVDCHEHLDDPFAFTAEISRITKPGGKVLISVPNGDESMFAVRLKILVGMTKEKYGHVVTGFDIPDMTSMLEQSGLTPVTSHYYSKFFTEMLELCINYAYVMLLSDRSDVPVETGTIAPSNKEQLEAVGKSYKLYGMIYPLFRLISRLDALLFLNKGYAVFIEAIKG